MQQGDGKKELQRRLKDVMVELEEVRREVKVKEEQVDVLNKKLNCFIHEVVTKAVNVSFLM